MKCVAFVTYNTMGDGLSNGWHEGPEGRRAFVLQHARHSGWAVDALLTPAQKEMFERGEAPANYARNAEKFANHVRASVEQLWDLLQEALPTLDHVVVYVGSRGAERVIELAANLPASKVTFVGCSCNLPSKNALIIAAGLSDAEKIGCECGGHLTMRALYERFIHSGSLLRQTEPALN